MAAKARAKGKPKPPEPPPPLMVKMKHVRMAVLCSRGAREWFASYGLSWSEFLENGLPAEVLEATGDPLAARAVCCAKEEAAAGGR